MCLPMQSSYYFFDCIGRCQNIFHSVHSMIAWVSFVTTLNSYRTAPTKFDWLMKVKPFGWRATCICFIHGNNFGNVALSVHSNTPNKPIRTTSQTFVGRTRPLVSFGHCFGYRPEKNSWSFLNVSPFKYLNALCQHAQITKLSEG